MQIRHNSALRLGVFYMKNLITVILSLLSISTGVYAASDTTLNTATDKFSYVVGLNLGKNFKAQDTSVNPNQLLKGLQDGLSGAKPLLTSAQQRQVMQSYQQKMLTKMQQQQQEQATTNLAAGKSFLAKNAKKSGVRTTKSGLQYKVLKAGKGISPKANDSVTVDYQGSLISGKVFDSSYTRGHPATFTVNQVIPGWTQALEMMKPGAVWMLYIPASLGYGNNAMGGLIPPGSTLIFKVHLISVKRS